MNIFFGQESRLASKEKLFKAIEIFQVRSVLGCWGNLFFMGWKFPGRFDLRIAGFLMFPDVFFSSFFVFQWSMQFDGIIFLHMNSDHDFCHILSGLLDVVVLNRVF